MREACALAAKGLGHTRPNPAVGAVIARKGEILGRGWHQRAGGDHAEVAAIKDAIRRHPTLTHAQLFKNATLYVTLEPCSKPGRVGACCEAIIAAGIRKICWACPDPNPVNRGRAKRILKRAGCTVTGWDPNLRKIAEKILAPFAKHITTGLPYVSVKLALSLDGKICDDSGEARWVSSEAARRATGCFRESVDVMMVGAETIRQDDPSLLCHTKRNDDLYRAIISKSGRLPKNAQVLTDAAKKRTLVYHDAVEAVRDLGRRGFLHILCEGGLKLATSLAEAGLVDEWMTVLSPKVIGTRPIKKAVTFKTVRASFPDNETVLAAFSRESPSALG